MEFRNTFYRKLEKYRLLLNKEIKNLEDDELKSVQDDIETERNEKNVSPRENYPFAYSGNLTIMYDAITGLRPEDDRIKIIVKLQLLNEDDNDDDDDYTGAPCVFSFDNFSNDQLPSKIAFLNIKQHVYSCPPHSHLFLVVELLAGYRDQLNHRGLAVVRLFSEVDQALLAGRWRIPFVFNKKSFPTQINEEEHEIYLRLLHPHQATSQEATKHGSLFRLYELQPTPLDFIDPSYLKAMVMEVYFDKLEGFFEYKRLFIIFNIVSVREDEIVYFQEEEKEELIKAFLGNQKPEAFHEIKRLVEIKIDSQHFYENIKQRTGTFFVISVIEKKKRAKILPLLSENDQEHLDESNAELICWTCVPLFTTSERKSSQTSLQKYKGNPKMKVNEGEKVLNLYQPPINHLCFADPDNLADRFSANAKAFLFFKPLIEAETTEINKDKNKEKHIEKVWHVVKPDSPPSDIFVAGDAFCLCVDQLLHLPHSCSIVYVSSSIIDKDKNSLGHQAFCDQKLDSSLRNPFLDFSCVFICPTISPTATLVFKIYTTNKTFNRRILLGSSYLNLFVRVGSFEVPAFDHTQVSLNNGGHQLRIYGKSDFSSDSVASNNNNNSNNNLIPAASLLVRLEKINEEDVLKFDLKDGFYKSHQHLRFHNHPYLPKDHSKALKNKRKNFFQQVCSKNNDASPKVYSNWKYHPSKNELKIMLALEESKDDTSMKNILTNGLLTPQETRSIKDIDDLYELIKLKWAWTMEARDVFVDVGRLVPYDCREGFYVCVDRAYNLPWDSISICVMTALQIKNDSDGSNATSKMVHIFYNVNFNSPGKYTEWKEQLLLVKKEFPSNGPQNIVLFFHVLQVKCQPTKKEFEFALADEAWCLMELMDGEYVRHGSFKLPLVDRKLDDESLFTNGFASTMKQVQENSQSFIEVRCSDGRRSEELDKPAQNQFYREATDDLISTDGKLLKDVKKLQNRLPNKLSSAELYRQLEIFSKNLVSSYNRFDQNVKKLVMAHFDKT